MENLIFMIGEQTIMTEQDKISILRSFCEDLADIVEFEHSKVWRTYYYLRRHPKLQKKYKNAYNVLALADILSCTSDNTSLYEDAKKHPK